MPSFDLTVTWAILLALAVFAYVVLDGFDLGIGMLFALFPGRRDRDVMMNSVAPVWDGNETWLVFGGGGLFAAFPLAYAVIMPAVYIPIIVMILALVFRGVAFEFRWRTERWRAVWDVAFIAGSALAAFMQGVTLGAIVQGITVDLDARAFGGGRWDWISPFSLLTGVSVMAGYALLGASWLVMKTQDALQDRARALSWRFGMATLFFIGCVSLATPFLRLGYFERWFAWPNIAFTAPVPLAVAVIAILMFRSVRDRDHEAKPFLLALALFGLTFAGLGISVWPNVVPPDLTIWDAAAPYASQVFMLIGAAIMLPLIVAYTGYAYWVFRGKVDPDAGYH